VGIGIFGQFLLSDLDPMTFIYELDPYSLEIYRMCKNELDMSSLPKVIVLQTNRQTAINTPAKSYSMLLCFADGQK